MSRVIEFILHLRGGPAYALVFLLPALESSAFIGFLFPGEIAIILGGVLAFQGRVSLPWVMAVAIGGAVVGDSVGYAVGARYGERIFKMRLVRWLVTPERRRKAEDLLRRRVANAVGGILWAGGFTMVGYLAGDAWRKVEHIAARASLLLAILLGIGIGIVVAARRIAA